MALGVVVGISWEPVFNKSIAVITHTCPASRAVHLGEQEVQCCKDLHVWLNHWILHFTHLLKCEVVYSRCFFQCFCFFLLQWIARYSNPVLGHIIMALALVIVMLPAWKRCLCCTFARAIRTIPDKHWKFPRQVHPFKASHIQSNDLWAKKCVAQSSHSWYFQQHPVWYNTDRYEMSSKKIQHLS